MLRTLKILVMGALILAAGAAQGAYRLSDRDRADIARIETYLNSLQSIRSDFVQLASGGRYAEGTLYIERPQRLRLDYARPSTTQVYANGAWLIYVDTELQEVSHVPISSTPAGFLVRDRIRLSGDVTVQRVTRNDKLISVELVQTGEPDAGRFVLTFADNPLTLRKWTVIDAQGISTNVSLVSPSFNTDIPRKVFIFDETRFDPELQ